MITEELVVSTALELTCEQYEAGRSMAELSEAHGLDQRMLKRLLVAHGAEIRTTRVPSKACKAGHDMAETGVQAWKTRNGKKIKNGWYCSACRSGA